MLLVEKKRKDYTVWRFITKKPGYIPAAQFLVSCAACCCCLLYMLLVLFAVEVGIDVSVRATIVTGEWGSHVACCAACMWAVSLSALHCTICSVQTFSRGKPASKTFLLPFHKTRTGSNPTSL